MASPVHVPRTMCRCPVLFSISEQSNVDGGRSEKTYPDDCLVDVRLGIREPLDLPGLPAEESVEVRSDFVAFALAERVALCASGLWR